MPRARDDSLIAAFAVVLRQARLGMSMTQEDVARLADVDRTFIGMLESGRRQPSLSVLCALEQAVDEKPGALLAKAYALSRRGSGRNAGRG